MKRCKGILLQRQEEFARAIGVSLATSRIKDYFHPKKLSQEEAWLGVTIPLQSAGTDAGTVYVALTTGDERDIEVYVGIQLRDRDLCARMFERLKKKKHKRKNQT